MVHALPGAPGALLSDGVDTQRCTAVSRYGLDVETWIDGGRIVVEIGGELDAYSAGVLREELARIAAPRPLRIAVVMAAVTFIDSAGIGVLVGAVKRARATGGGVALVGCSGRVESILRRMGLHRVFGLCGGLEEAFAWLDEEASGDRRGPAA